MKPLIHLTNKLLDNLKKTTWFNLLKAFLVSEEFYNIISNLETKVKEGERFTPSVKIMFEAFKKCSYDNLKVVIVGEEPYPQLYVADGMAFSCSCTNKLEPPLRFIQHAIERTVYQKADDSNLKADLSDWASQGVLLLNLALTTELEKPGRHLKLWKPFIAWIVDSIVVKKPNVFWILIGEKTHYLEELLPNDMYISLSHPSYRNFETINDWDCKNAFNLANDKLKEKNIEPIVW